MMDNPFKSNYSDKSDTELIEAALGGSKAALEALLQRHQDYIFNVAHKMVLNTEDAQDITQEVLIKVITNLSKFQGKSAFRTWLYRITTNHFLSMKRKRVELQEMSFEGFGKAMDELPNDELTELERLEMADFIEDARLGCMSGMLMCLSREQRLVFILGEIFEIDHNLGSEILEISKANFRKRLERARKDLYQFMNAKCGLINAANPCRCHRKTKAFIKKGWVNTENLQFNTDFRKRIHQIIHQKDKALKEVIEVDYQQLYQSHPFQEKETVKALSHRILTQPKVRDIFELD